MTIIDTHAHIYSDDILKYPQVSNPFELLVLQKHIIISNTTLLLCFTTYLSY